MKPLQKLVLDRMAELDLSFRRAADKSGGLVSPATLNNISLGVRDGKNLTDSTIQGIALALDLPLSKVREAAGAKADRPVEFRLPRKAENLTARERRAVLAMVDALLAAHADEDEG